jgi:hypothetical protein
MFDVELAILLFAVLSFAVFLIGRRRRTREASSGLQSSVKPFRAVLESPRLVVAEASIEPQPAVSAAQRLSQEAGDQPIQ